MGDDFWAVRFAGTLSSVAIPISHAANPQIALDTRHTCDNHDRNHQNQKK
jgi:hypothetical protein